jgi:hypothetical protein
MGNTITVPFMVIGSDGDGGHCGRSVDVINHGAEGVKAEFPKIGLENLNSYALKCLYLLQLSTNLGTTLSVGLPHHLSC